MHCFPLLNVISFYFAAHICDTGYTKCKDGIQCVELYSYCSARYSSEPVCKDGSDKDMDFCRSKYDVLAQTTFYTI